MINCTTTENWVALSDRKQSLSTALEPFPPPSLSAVILVWTEDVRGPYQRRRINLMGLQRVRYAELVHPKSLNAITSLRVLSPIGCLQCEYVIKT